MVLFLCCRYIYLQSSCKKCAPNFCGKSLGNSCVLSCFRRLVVFCMCDDDFNYITNHFSEVMQRKWEKRKTWFVTRKTAQRVTCRRCTDCFFSSFGLIFLLRSYGVVAICGLWLWSAGDWGQHQRKCVRYTRIVYRMRYLRWKKTYRLM